MANICAAQHKCKNRKSNLVSFFFDHVQQRHFLFSHGNLAFLNSVVSHRLDDMRSCKYILSNNSALLLNLL